MADEDRLRQRMTRAARMQEWAEGDGGLFEVFAAVETQYVAELVESDPTDTAVREAIYHRIRAFRDVRTVMEAAIRDGHGAEKIFENLKRKAERQNVNRTAPQYA